VAATTVGVVATLVWMHAGRAWIPVVLAVVVPALLVVFDLVPRGLAAETPARLRPVLEPILSGAAIVLAPVLALEWAAGRPLGQLSNAIGVVSSLDLLGVTDPDLPVTAVMRDPLFVPESKSLPELLGTLQAEGRNLALVVDEYGGFIGLVTVEDLVEEIVGEIEDEYDVAREHYRRVAP